MGVVKKYSEADVGRILKQSEGHGASDGRGQGHAEGLHEMVAVGRGRESTSSAGLADRLLDERKAITGAFDGTQVKAVTFALNSASGQLALTHLNTSEAAYVFAKIDVSNQNYRMTEATANVPSGRNAQGPLSNPQLTRPTVSLVAMKLVKTNSGELHIRTAYPMSAPLAGHPSTCMVSYKSGTSQNFDI